MKKCCILITAVVISAGPGNVHALDTWDGSGEPNCAAGSCTDNASWNGNAFYDCKRLTCTCLDPYGIGENKMYEFACGCSYDSDCYEYDNGEYCDAGVCRQGIDCTNCTTTSWAASGTGYQKRTSKTCNRRNGTCSSSVQYQCAVNYYGTSTNGTQGCDTCPPLGGVFTDSARTRLVWGKTNSAGTTAITGCYIASGTYYDATGTFKLNSNCGYK